jgi:hypothetical protein
MIAMFGRALRPGLAALALVLAMFTASASQAGVTNGAQTVDGLSIYLGVVPATVVRGHAQDHPEARMHGGPPDRSIHDVHLVVAVLDASTGVRITDATLVAQILELGGKRWSIRLEPMTVNGALTYGGYASFVKASDYWIGVQIQRPRRQHPVMARFTYAHD